MVKSYIDDFFSQLVVDMHAKKECQEAGTQAREERLTS